MSAAARAEFSEHTYILKYRFLNGHLWTDREHIPQATNPVQAIDRFHRFIQRSKELADRKKVIRPKLKWDEYEVVQMAQAYTDNPSGNGELNRRNVIDLPKSPNPDLNKPKPPKVETAVFGFWGTCRTPKMENGVLVREEANVN